jgi:cephalosporin-C deacetylase-like acetyl esterase
MARSRLNWLDLHGTYDLWTTRFPNLYAYFVASASFPAVGVAPEIQQKNLAQLNHVIELAHARGVRVSLMSYEAHFYTPHTPKPPYEENEPADYAYTREVVEALIRAAPGLDALGYRIGESGHSGDFFRCYEEAVAASGRDIPLLTRSWITRRAAVVPLARASNDYTVEIKFNGEQWGPPYPIAGGRVPGWHSYSFEDYLSDSSALPGAAPKRLWDGNLAESGERWPAQPYKVVWQVRANGTHRIFPFYEPEWVRRTVRSMALGTARGFTIEPLNAYFPASPRYYVARPEDVAFRWIHQRDALYLMLWGRLGYDPATADAVFDAAARAHLGVRSNELVEAWKTASRVVPTAFTALSFGPDHRDHAPELEWGGDTGAWLASEPFDAHALLSLQEELAFTATGARDGRTTTERVASELSMTAALLAPERLAALDRGAGPAAREVVAACRQLGALARYDAGRLGMARYQALADAGPPGEHAREAAHVAASQAWAGWSALAAEDFYKPFPDRLRMGTGHYHWRDALEEVRREVEGFRARVPLERDFASAGGGLARTPPLLELVWRDDGRGRIECSLRGLAGEPVVSAEAWLLEKPLPSSTFFHRVPFEDGKASFERQNAGHLIAAEVALGGTLERIPSYRTATPYLVVPSRELPTPPYYSSQESLRFLDPRVLAPERHGLLLVASRAWDFHRSFSRAEQRKLLDAVERGMTLLVLQQDYTSGRYPLDWLPARPVVENALSDVFDPGGALGLERIERAGILYQPFRPGNGWEVPGNGGLARLAHGQGSIWLCQARLVQNMHVPAAARAMRTLLELGGREKPVVVVDGGSEGNRFTTALWTNFLCAHGIPFLTLGEVIAAEQGVAAFAPVARLDPSELLGGRGPAMLRAFQESAVRSKAARPVPATRAELEARQRADRPELLRSLGLEPLPERTPLNARITHVLERDGYRLESLVFDSRPGMPVTAHLYVPTRAPGEKLPVIVNPHGHWPHKKGEPVVQARAIAQALHGYLALVVDSPGWSFEGDAPIERRGAGPHDDLRLVLGSTSATSVYVWDLMRALDYLETRPEADTTRVGITGASGGGLATMYAFAADERFDVAVPVVYATSMEVNPHNGCLCNHVPGALQLGDRADVLALRAPAPVLVIGAEEDAEFPPEGTRRTGAKLAALWKLFDAEARVGSRLFPGPHDYNQAMRELALGFFDQHLRGLGDGSPVPEPALTTEPAGDRALFALSTPPAVELTLREVATTKLHVAEMGFRGATPDPAMELAALQGGLSVAPPSTLRELGTDARNPARRFVTFESEPGLKIPALLLVPEKPKAIGLVLVSEGGKLAAEREFPIERFLANGWTCLLPDVRGTGELAALDARLCVYLGQSAAFGMGHDAAQAGRALRERTPRLAVLGRGAAGSQAALFASLLEPSFELVVGLGGLGNFSDAFEERVSWLALLPRADLAPTLADLRRHAAAGLAQPERLHWTLAGEPEPDLVQLVNRYMGW